MFKQGKIITRKPPTWLLGEVSACLLPQKRKAEAKAEFEAEQEYLKTISLLSEEEQKKYKERQVGMT